MQNIEKIKSSLYEEAVSYLGSPARQRIEL